MQAAAVTDAPAKDAPTTDAPATDAPAKDAPQSWHSIRGKAECTADPTRKHTQPRDIAVATVATVLTDPLSTLKRSFQCTTHACSASVPTLRARNPLYDGFSAHTDMRHTKGCALFFPPYHPATRFSPSDVHFDSTHRALTHDAAHPARTCTPSPSRKNGLTPAGTPTWRSGPTQRTPVVRSSKATNVALAAKASSAGRSRTSQHDLRSTPTTRVGDRSPRVDEIHRTVQPPKRQGAAAAPPSRIRIRGGASVELRCIPFRPNVGACAAPKWCHVTVGSCALVL